MAKALIAHLVAYYYPADAPGGRGRFVLDGGYLFDEERMYADLEARCRGQPYPQGARWYSRCLRPAVITAASAAQRRALQPSKCSPRPR